MEPELADRAVAWFYNRLIYRTTRGADTIYCAIEPGYRVILVVWKKAGEPVVTLNLENVSSLKVVYERGAQKMIASFDPSTELPDFEFQLRPSIQIKWGT